MNRPNRRNNDELSHDCWRIARSLSCWPHRLYESGYPTDPPACNAACVTLTDTKIASSRVTFTAGEPYYFVVTNEGKVPSNFIITAELQILNPGSQYNPILYISSTIPPGASRNFTFAFPITAPQGAVEFATTLVDPGGPGVLLPVQVELGETERGFSRRQAMQRRTLAIPLS
jgi:hypothetical protein